MACLVTLKQEIRTLESLFPKTNNRFQIINASVDEINCRFVSSNGKKYDIHANITETYPGSPPVWFAESEETSVINAVQVLSNTTGLENHVVCQVHILVRELCRLHNVPEPPDLDRLLQVKAIAPIPPPRASSKLSSQDDDDGMFDDEDDDDDVGIDDIADDDDDDEEEDDDNETSSDDEEDDEEDDDYFERFFDDILGGNYQDIFTLSNPPELGPTIINPDFRKKSIRFPKPNDLPSQQHANPLPLDWRHYN
uniref:Ubiquitin-conjugating enzyme E2 25 n=1 Tax=Cacopsylla melanoneura TaxID=428564 RepID=A0A8D8PNN4_9HEMI